MLKQTEIIFCKLKKQLGYCLWMFFCVFRYKRNGSVIYFFSLSLSFFHLKSNGCFSEWLRKTSNGSRDKAQNVPCPQCRAIVHSVGKNHFLKNIEKVGFPSFFLSYELLEIWSNLLLIYTFKNVDRLVIISCCRIYLRVFLR